MSNLAGRLSERSAAGRDAAEAAEASSAQGSEDAERDRDGRIEKEASEFAGENLESAIQEIGGVMDSEADKGNTHARHTWKVYDISHYQGNEQGLANYRALIANMTAHLEENDLTVSSVEFRGQVRDFNTPISDGFSQAHPPMKDAGYTEIGIDISWGDSEEE